LAGWLFVTARFGFTILAEACFAIRLVQASQNFAIDVAIFKIEED
jgi:hypothetical protein